MAKRFLWLVFGLTLLVSGAFYLDHNSKLATDYCAFCDPKVLEAQTFYEDELVRALYTHKPITPGHSLIIPKRHVERFEELSDAEITQMGRVIKKVHAAASKVFHTSAYLLLQKNGYEVGQTVPHVHVHYVPRKEGDDSTLKFLAQMYISNWKKPLSTTQMQPIIEELREAMQQDEEKSALR